MVMAFFMGFGMAQRTNAISAAVPHEEIGVASGVLALVRNIAGAFGIAVFSTVLTQTIYRNVLDITRDSILYLHTPQTTAAFTELITLKAQIDAYGTIYGIAAVLLVIGAVLAILIRAPKEPTETVIAEG
jgi:hypothetical protein